MAGTSARPQTNIFKENTMKTISSNLNSVFFGVALVIALMIIPLESCAGDRALSENVNAADIAVDAPIPAPTPPPQSKEKKKGKSKKNMETKSTAVPNGMWGTNGIIFGVEASGVNIQYECADGQIEQPLKVDERGNFAVSGVHIRQRPGPMKLDDKQARQNARYEGKISGNTMTLKVTLTETGEVIGDYTLERGKNVRLHRCY